MKAKNFNKSQIMKRAWNCYRKHSKAMTFGQCLRWSWKKAWEELKKTSMGAYAIAISRKKRDARKQFDERLKRYIHNCGVTTSNWAFDYGRRAVWF